MWRGNINIESITYELLTYNNYSVVKVINCYSAYFDIIECYSKKDEHFNLDNHYYFYYNKADSHLTFDENDILEDDKRVSLIFEPEIDIED